MPQSATIWPHDKHLKFPPRIVSPAHLSKLARPPAFPLADCDGAVTAVTLAFAARRPSLLSASTPAPVTLPETPPRLVRLPTSPPLGGGDCQSLLPANRHSLGPAGDDSPRIIAVPSPEALNAAEMGLAGSARRPLPPPPSPASTCAAGQEESRELNGTERTSCLRPKLGVTSAHTCLTPTKIAASAATTWK